MRFHKSFAALLAASISISGCSPIQRNTSQVEGSFRTAPTSELLTMAERYERQGDYAHAARLYEELLKGDPTRTQVRTRLQALAMHGVVSPQAQGVLMESVDEIVASHQPQLAAAESQREIDRHLASMTPVSTPGGYQLVDPSVARGVAQVQIPSESEPWAQETFAVTAEAPSAPAPETEFEPTFADSPSPSADQVQPESIDWHQTVIRPQDEPRRPVAAGTSETEATSEGRGPISRVVSSGSRLWHAANGQTETVAQSTSAESTPSNAIVAEGSPAWAAPSNPSFELASVSRSTMEESDWRIPADRAADASALSETADPFCDPIVSGEHSTTGTTADAPVLFESASDAVCTDTTHPLQRAQSCFTLWQVCGDADRAVPTLVELLGNEDAQVVEVACFFLGELGPAASLAVAPLQAVRDSADETTSILAAEALAKIAPQESESVAHIVQASRSVENESRLLAAITLAGVDHQHGETVVPALARLLEDENPQVRSAAALSLGGWGDAAASCCPKLEELALGDVPEVSEAARIALDCIEK
jgi:hypothetical protein